MNDNFFSAQGYAGGTRVYINGREINKVKDYQVKHASREEAEITVTFYAKSVDVNLRLEIDHGVQNPDRTT